MTPRRAASPARDPEIIVIATRASELAQRQARLVQSALAARGLQSQLETFRTVGDKKMNEPLSAIGGKGLFTKELEDELLRRRVDCCVHSLKDLPTDSPAGLEVAACLPREDPRDVLVLNDAVAAEKIADLPRGTRVGTSSLRRRAQLLGMRGDLEVVELRGNVPTRLRKVDEGQVHAAILAAAGLLRLDVHQRIAAFLEPPLWLPAAGQGAIAVQVRSDDERMREVAGALNDAETALATRAERAFLAALQGGCQVPIGALLMRDGVTRTLHGMIADVHGRRVLRDSALVDAADPEGAGRRLALDLLNRGAWEILAKLRTTERVPSPQPE